MLILSYRRTNHFVWQARQRLGWLERALRPRFILAFFWSPTMYRGCRSDRYHAFVKDSTPAPFRA